MKDLWQEESVGAVLQLEYGKPLDDADRKVDGLYPVYGANGEKNRSDKFYFDKPSIIVGRKGSAGEVNLTEEKFWPLDVTYFVTFDERQYELRFLYYLLATLELPSLAKGVKPGINRNEVYSQVVKVPPLLEQQRIVGILDEAFDGIATAKANAEKNLQNARAIFGSHLQSVFSQHGEGWVEKRLREVAESISTGPFGTMLHKSDYVPDGIPLVNPMNIVDSRIVPSNKMMVNEETRDRLSSYMLKAGDVVIGRRGELGRCALVTEREAGWLCGTGSFFVRLSDAMDGKFFVALFGSDQFKARLEASAVGTTMSNLNHGILNDLVLPVPPIAIQRKIMNKVHGLLSKTQHLESIYQQKLAALEALKKSLLHQAFSGQL
jgi:type I restriction enzyme S subunit